VLLLSNGFGMYQCIKSVFRNIGALLFVVMLVSPSFVQSAGTSFTASGSFTVPAGVTQIFVTGSGYGGRGADVDGSPYFADGRVYSGGGGGSAGSVLNQSISVTPGSTYPVTISYAGGTVFGSFLTLTNGQDASQQFGGNGGTPNGQKGGDGESVLPASVPPPGRYAVVGSQGGSSLISLGGTGGSYGYSVMGECFVDVSSMGVNGSGGGGGTFCYEDGRGYGGAGANGGEAFLDLTWVNPTTGNINVSANNASASWTLSGPTTLTGSGLAQSYTAVPTGNYTLTWNPVAGYSTPVSQSLTLTANNTVTFAPGNYTATPGYMSGATLTAVPNACGSIKVSVTGMTSGPQWYINMTDNGAPAGNPTGTTASFSGDFSASPGSSHQYRVTISNNFGDSRVLGPVIATGPVACIGPSVNLFFQ
jgi:hypothetical protein